MQREVFLLVAVGYPLAAIAQSYPEVLCYRNWYFDRSRPAPRRCPTPDFFTYYECCQPGMDSCCRRFRPEPLIMLGIGIIILIFCCCCICLGILCKKRSTKKEQEKYTENPHDISRDERECRVTTIF